MFMVTNSRAKRTEEIINRVISTKKSTPTLVYTDGNGNTLWVKYLPSTGRIQSFAKNAEGKLVDEEGVGILMREAGRFSSKSPTKTVATSEKGKRIQGKPKFEKMGGMHSNLNLMVIEKTPVYRNVDGVKLFAIGWSDSKTTALNAGKKMLGGGWIIHIGAMKNKGVDGWALFSVIPK